MDKQQKDLLTLEPNNEVVFDGPLKNLMDAYVTISNPDDNRTVQFKIKTTAPKTYFVRPNVGQLKPKESIKVQITLQTFLYEREKHKFLVQATYGPEKEEFDPNFWKDVDSKSVWNVKLKSLVKVADGKEGLLQKKNISEAAEIVGDENETLVPWNEQAQDDVVEGQTENNISDDEYERDVKSKSFDPNDQIEAAKSERKSGSGFFFYFASLLILVAALVGAGYYYQNNK